MQLSHSACKSSYSRAMEMLPSCMDCDSRAELRWRQRDGKPCDSLAFSWRALLTFQPWLGSGGNGCIPCSVQTAVGGSGEQPRAAGTMWLLGSPCKREAPGSIWWELCLSLLQALTALNEGFSRFLWVCSCESELCCLTYCKCCWGFLPELPEAGAGS